MSLIGIIVALIVILLVFWAVRALLAAFGAGEPLSTVIHVLLVVLVVLWLLGAIGGVPLGSLGHVRIG